MYDNHIISRFWERVAKGMPDECWNWKAGGSQGYGELRTGTRSEYTHRISWKIHNGEIPTGLQVCHTCDNRACVNPAHLFLGTMSDNMNDMTKKGRRAKGSGHGRALLNEQQVIEIRNVYQNGGISQHKLARLFGVSRSAISHIIYCDNWKECKHG